MTIEIPLLDLVGAVLLLVISVRLVYEGWLILVRNREILFLPAAASVKIARIIFGSDSANQRKERIIRVYGYRTMGRYSLSGGVLLLIASILALFDSIYRITIVR